MKRTEGFTLIELVIFIVASAILMTAILMPAGTSFMNTSTTSNQIAANLLAQQCMEWLLGDRALSGYSALSCPSTPTGTLCASPTGYTVTPSVVCTTLNGDTNFKTLSVVVSGNGSATLQTLIANY